MLKVTISKEFTADFAHIVTTQQLPKNLRCKCRNIHGHTYTFIAKIRGSINPKTGMVIDYTMLKPFKEFIDSFFDHSFVVTEREHYIVREMAIIHKQNLPQDDKQHYIRYDIQLPFKDKLFNTDDVYIERVGTLTTIFGIPATTAEYLSLFLSSVLADIISNAKHEYPEIVGNQPFEVAVAVKETPKTEACIDFIQV